MSGAFGPGRKHGLLPALAKNMPPAYFLNASRPPGGSLATLHRYGDANGYHHTPYGRPLVVRNNEQFNQNKTDSRGRLSLQSNRVTPTATVERTVITIHGRGRRPRRPVTNDLIKIIPSQSPMVTALPKGEPCNVTPLWWGERLPPYTVGTGVPDGPP